MGHNDFANVEYPSALYTIIFPPEMSLPIYDENPDHPEGEIFNYFKQFTVYIKINDRPAIVHIKPPYNLFGDRNILSLANEKSGGNNDQFIKNIGDRLMVPLLYEIDICETELDELRKKYDLNAVSFRQNPGYKFYHDCLTEMQNLKSMTLNDFLQVGKIKEIKNTEELKFVLDSLKNDDSYPYLESNTLIKGVELLGQCLRQYNLIFEKSE